MCKEDVTNLISSTYQETCVKIFCKDINNYNKYIDIFNKLIL